MSSRRLVSLLLISLVVVVGACSKSSDTSSKATTTTSGGPTQSAGKSGGGGDGKPLVIARDMDMTTLDPSLAYCDTCQIYLNAVYETVIGLDPKDNQTFIPRLAERWDANNDLTEFTFKLDKRAKFSDGSPVEAKDVKFSWERLANMKGSPAYFMDGVKSIEAPDAATVIVRLEESDSAFLAKVNAPYTGIFNSKVAAANGATAASDADKTDKAEPWFLKNSAGSGPYKLVSFQEGAELRLTRNESYWSTAAPIKDVIMKQTKDAVTQRQLLESGDVDIAMQINPDLAKQMKSGGDITVKQVPSFNFVYIALSPGAQGNKVDLNAKVREAVRYAIDYEGLLDVTLGGAGRKQASPIPNGFLGTKDLPLPSRDLNKAKALLAEGGYPNGFEIDAVYATVNVYGVDFNTMMQKVQKDLGDAGIKVKLQPSERSVWVQQLRGGGIPLTAIYFAPDHTDPIQYVQYFGMVPGSSWSKRAGGSAGAIVNKKEVELAAKALATKDATERGKVYDQLGREMIADGYIIPLANPDLVLAHRSNIEGMHYSACCNLELARLTRK